MKLTLLISIIFIYFLGLSSAHSEATNEITVTLFGQPCLLNGPVNKETLKAIHSISPEQVYLSENPTGESTKRILDKVKSANPIPAGLDRYRDRLTKRLEAIVAFYQAIPATKKEGKSATLLNAIKSYLSAPRLKEFETLAQKIDAAKKLDNETVAALSERFQEWIEPDPEEEFHKSIQKMKVHYTCEFSDETGNEE